MFFLLMLIVFGLLPIFLTFDGRCSSSTSMYVVSIRFPSNACSLFRTKARGIWIKTLHAIASDSSWGRPERTMHNISHSLSPFAKHAYYCGNMSLETFDPIRPSQTCQCFYKFQCVMEGAWIAPMFPSFPAVCVHWSWDCKSYLYSQKKCNFWIDLEIASIQGSLIQC